MGAAWRDGDGRIVTRAFVLGKEGLRYVPAHLVELEKIVADLIDESGCDVVSIEKDFGRGKGSTTLRSYHAIARAGAQRKGATPLCEIMPSTARKLALGYGGGSKPEVERRARTLIPETVGKTNDEVDAAILLVATEVRLAEQERLAEIRKAAAKAERATKALARRAAKERATS